MKITLEMTKMFTRIKVDNKKMSKKKDKIISKAANYKTNKIHSQIMYNNRTFTIKTLTTIIIIYNNKNINNIIHSNNNINNINYNIKTINNSFNNINCNINTKTI